MQRKLTAVLVVGLLSSAGSTALALDEGAAQSLMKKSGCLKCHALSAKKEGPAFKETAAKYKGKADAEAKLFTHLTTSPMIEVDGNKERHDGLKTKKDDDVKNVVQYILSR